MINASSANSRAGACPPDNELPENSQEHLDKKLDHAIEETFPTSDPVSVSITKGGAIDYDRQDVTVSSRQGQGRLSPAGNRPEQAHKTLRETVDRASEATRDAYNQSKHFVRQIGERYPAADRIYQKSAQRVGQRVTEHPWISLVVAGAVGYGLAWLIHGRDGGHDKRIPAYARTANGYTASRYVEDEP
jgi:ElaB/YqjD/DUF883 family membrane-anchored ribosome-binding protein